MVTRDEESPDGQTPEPLITSLEGFPDPVRDPETGMIIPQSRKERKALEAAQEEYLTALSQRKSSGSAPVAQSSSGAAPVMVAGSPDEKFEPVQLDDPDTHVVDQHEDPVLVEEVPKTSRAGRDLPAAIIVGVTLLSAAIAGIIWMPLLVMTLIIALLVLGVWELAQIFKHRQVDVPIIPLWFGAVAIPVAAFYGGIDAMVFALFGTMILALFWVTVGEPHKPLPTFAATAFILLWVPFLLSFGVVLLRQPSGHILVAILLLAVVGNDTFGYIVGVLFGKHPMAPKISPKKSWEGFAGSLFGAILATTLFGGIFLDAPWWYLVLAGVVIVVAATTGDFAASMIKRDLGVKDMGTTLPGHGGVMDRLDSIVFAAPVAFTLFVVFSP